MIAKKTTVPFFLVLILCPSVLSGGSGPRRFSFGFYGGWSLGLGYEFDWHTRPSRSDDYTLGFHLGAYVQYNLSPVLGIQVNGSCQRGTNDWTFAYPGFPYDEGSDPFRVVSANLNAVVTPLRYERMSFYLLGGSGISSGDFEDLGGISFNLTAGAGVRIGLSETGGPALNIGACYIHLIDPEPYGNDTANCLKFLIGLEF